MNTIYRTTGHHLFKKECSYLLSIIRIVIIHSPVMLKRFFNSFVPKLTILCFERNQTYTCSPYRVYDLSLQQYSNNNYKLQTHTQCTSALFAKVARQMSNDEYVKLRIFGRQHGVRRRAATTG